MTRPPPPGMSITTDAALAMAAASTPEVFDVYDLTEMPSIHAGGHMSTQMSTQMPYQSSPSPSAPSVAAPSPSIPPSPLPAPPSPPPPPPPATTIVRYAPAQHAHLVVYLAALHAACITRDGLTGFFALPLHHDKLLSWWKRRLGEADATFLLVRGTTSAAHPAGSDLVGVAMLCHHAAETSPHVAAVPLLLCRQPAAAAAAATGAATGAGAREAGARQLLAAVEAAALSDRRTLLTAEAEADSEAAATFAQLGFTEAGRIPRFVEQPHALPRAQVLFYKDLLPSLTDAV